MATEMNWLDRALMQVSPSTALKRVRARALAITIARHYEAAQPGRRTTNWHRSGSDANAANAPALATLRAHARDLNRNNSWARRAQRVISNNTVGWGIQAKPAAPGAEKFAAAWKSWAESTACDVDGRLSFYGIQASTMRTVPVAGEVLLRRMRRPIEDGRVLPLQIQLLEPDFIDTTKDNLQGEAGGPIIQGVEFDRLGRRVAYWLYEQHPGSTRLGSFGSKRVPAADIIHVYYSERPGQVRGVSWYSPAIVNLKDFDEFEDATLMRQKIAALFAAFVSDVNGDGAALGATDATEPLIETIEPGQITRLPTGGEVSFSNPPLTTDDGFSTRTLRRIAAGIGVTYEDMTGDYSQVNFSSSRMARISHWGNVHDWRWNMLIPTMCDGVWAWAMEAAGLIGLIDSPVAAEWTPPPMPMIEPDREGLAYSRLVRNGVMTHDEMVREQGSDPETHWTGFAKGLQRLDELGIVLDSDPRRVSQAGLTQERVGGKGGAAAKAEEKAADEGDDAAAKEGRAEPTVGEQIASAVREIAGTIYGRKRTLTLVRDNDGRVTGAKEE